MGSLGEPNSSLPWCDRIMCSTRVFNLGGKLGRLSMVFSTSAIAHLDVAQQRAFDGVVEADLPAQFADFADVVQDDAGEQQVAIEDGVVGGDAVGQSEQTDHVLQQAAEPGVVELPGGWGFAVGLGKVRHRPAGW